MSNPTTWALYYGSHLISSKQAQDLAADPKILHILNRLSFGIRPGDIESIQSIGIDGYIKSQLVPESISEPIQLTKQLEKLETLQMSPVELFKKYNPRNPKNGQQLTEAERKEMQKQRQRLVQQAVQSRLLRAIASPRQLQEVMVDFWFNHFNVFVGKGLTRIWVGAYEQQAIRPHVLGRFRDLLAASARHPAMLFYLDNWQNTAPNTPGAKGRLRGLNENYARELMELHTLGVDGGYTQDDVITLARILTGWGLDNRGRRGDENGFYFDSDRHDYSDKVFLGIPIKGSGISEVEQVLDILARHPACARYISYKLAQYFVADDPPKSLIDNLAKRFLETDGDIQSVLQTLFESNEFLDPKYYGNKFKTPYQYVISLVRSTNAQNPNLRTVYAMLRELGMPLYGCQTPNGYKNIQQAWLNPDATIRRVSFATAIANGRLNKDKSVNADQLISTLGANFSLRTQKVLESTPPELKTALILGSPEIMYR